MKTSLLLFAALAAMALPCSQVRSQALLPAPTDPMVTLQALTKANDDLLKRQEASLAELVELTSSAHEARILSKRG